MNNINGARLAGLLTYYELVTMVWPAHQTDLCYSHFHRCIGTLQILKQQESDEVLTNRKSYCCKLKFNWPGIKALCFDLLPVTYCRELQICSFCLAFPFKFLTPSQTQGFRKYLATVSQGLATDCHGAVCQIISNDLIFASRNNYLFAFYASTL